MRGLRTGLGLILGAGVGLLVAVIFLDAGDPSLAMIFGAGFGLVIGAVLDVQAGPPSHDS